MKYVLLTGASGGLGLKIAEYLLNKNYFVIMLYNTNNNLDYLTNKYHNSIKHQIDITNEDDIVKLKKYLDEKNIKIDILINNAGIDHVSDIDSKNIKTFTKVYSVNAIGAFLMIKHFGSEIDSNHGYILNISSDNTDNNYDIVTLEYDMSKSALNMLTKEYARYYKNAHVNSILFGWLDTNMNNIPEEMKKYINFVSFNRACDAIYEMINTDLTGIFKIVN